MVSADLWCRRRRTAAPSRDRPPRPAAARQRLGDHVGNSRGSAGSASGGLELQPRMPDRRRRVSSKIARPSTNASFLGGILDWVPVGVLRAALDVVDRAARHRERDPQPNQRLASRRCATTPSPGDDTSGGGWCTAAVTGPPWSADIHHPATGDMPLEGPGRLNSIAPTRRIR